MQAALDAFVRHLTHERDRSPHTLRAYRGDIASLLDHMVRLRHGDVCALDISVLRSWLARLASEGRSRSTLSRRAAAARVFSAWAHRAGLLSSDPVGNWRRPGAAGHFRPCWRRDRHVTSCRQRLKVSAAASVTSSSPAAASAVAVRDSALLELLYASGIRVGELVGLDVDDIDHGRRVVRVLGKGRKERTVPTARRLRPRWRDGYTAAGRCLPLRAAVRLFFSACGAARGPAHRPPRRA